MMVLVMVYHSNIKKKRETIFENVCFYAFSLVQSFSVTFTLT